MTNRHERRVVAKSAPKCPNISGTDEACENCKFASDPEVEAKILKAINPGELKAGQPASQPLPADERHCLRYPMLANKKIWGWCGEHQPKP